MGLIIDFFAGGGGASVGIEMALGREVDIAINHDPEAIRMHKVNHPNTLHLTEDIFTVNLQRYVKGKSVDLLWASPDCTSHSKAKGGQPRKQGLRVLPWAVYKHAKMILPSVIIMENVEEIQQWGPLDKKGKPIPSRKGEDYKKFITAMCSLGYRFDSKELIAADYGAPTTRKRWYAIFRRDHREIVWPHKTHSKNETDEYKPWEPIWKHLDLLDFGKSIFGREKPLAEKTMNRIARGLEKFVFMCPEPFIAQINHTGDNFHEPIQAITPMNGYNLVTPMLIQYHSETSKNEVRGQKVTAPIQTIDTSNRYGLVMSFLTKFYKSGTGQSILETIHTITTSPGHFGQISVYAIPIKQLQDYIDSDMHDIMQKATWVSQFIMEYYGTGIGQQLHEPLHTVVTKDRFALITVMGNSYAILDIFLRMLNSEELKLGQGFPKDYILDHDITGKKISKAGQVARIGNSVVPLMAKELVLANCPYLKVGERMPNMQIIDEEYQIRFA